MKLRSFLVLALLTTGGACGTSTDSPSSTVVGLRVEVAPGSKVFNYNALGTITQLQVHAIDANGELTAPPAPVTFTSRDAAVARVSAEGLITTIGKGGTFIVGTLTLGGRELSDSVQVAYAEGAQ